MIEASSMMEQSSAYVQNEVQRYSIGVEQAVQKLNEQNNLFLHMASRPLREPCPDLRLVWEGMQEDKFVLKPTLEELEHSYRTGDATVLIGEVEGCGEVGVAYIRRLNLLNSQIKLALGVGASVTVDLQEIGSSYTVPAFRKGGVVDGKRVSYYELMRRMEMAKAIPAMLEGKLLVVGTSKNMRIIEINQALNNEQLFQDFRLGLFPTVHTQYPMLAPFTCVCTPDFGKGFQFSGSCEKRVKEPQLKQLKVLSLESKDKLEIPCTMYISDPVVAECLDEQLANAFSRINPQNPQAALVESLRSIEYYS